MLKSTFDAVMERRARGLLRQAGAWIPSDGPVLDLGSGTGHFAALLERERRIRVLTADVTDIHVVGRPPVIIRDGALPFDDGMFTAALLFFMLAYPADPAAVLREAARVTRGPIVLVQTVSSGRFGYAWHRSREFVWTIVAFRASKLLGYVPRAARFTMNTRRYYTTHTLQRELHVAGLRIRERRERPVLPGGVVKVVGWLLERDD